MSNAAVEEPAKILSLSFSRLMALTSGALAMVVLIGWASGLVTLRQPFDGSPSVKANTAICFFLSAVSLYLCTLRPTRSLRRIARVLAVVVLVLAALTLAQYLGSVDLGIDQALFRDPGAGLTVHPGRMAPNTSLCFLFISIFLLSFDATSRVAKRVRAFLLISAGGLTVFALVGYAYGIRQLYAVPLLTPMAFPTAILFLLLLTGLTSARPEMFLVRLLTGSANVSVVARVLLPAAVTVPLLLGWGRLHLERHGSLDGPTSTALVALGNAILSTSILLAAARVLQKKEEESNLARESLTASELSLQKTAGELQRTIRENALIMANSLDVICTIDAEGRFGSVSPACEALWGYKPEELVGRAYIELVHPDDREKTGEAAVAVMAGQAAQDFQNRYIRKDGGLTVVMWSALWSESEQVMFCVARDHTHRARIEEALNEANASLQQANSELESFSYSVSHDLRAPVRAIDGYARMLAEDYAAQVDDEGKRFIQTIQNEARRMGMLIDDLLAFSRLSRQSLATGHVDVGRLAKEVFEEVKRASSNAGTRLVLHELRPAIGDRALLRQVLVNLISNALKFSGKKPDPLIEVGGEVDGEMNTYWVKDNGVGFDMKYVDKLFGVFHRLHASDEFEGTGVGLAIVQRVVQRHGGRVWASGVSGEGATFYFTLPSESPARTSDPDVRKESAV